ncbi:MAG: phosphotransferase [Solirubrobacterales bacterium]|jgi:aminoglycoside phosphotransferase (APT) family kinase protein|nr:phosphotransferase [Solirubrobacterales bacterium]
MALINELDPTTARQRLAAWLPSVIPGATDLAVTDVHVPSSNGMSSESMLLEARWQQDGAPAARGFVARVAPTDGGLFETYDLAREGLVMGALADGTDVPAPRVVAHERSGEVLGKPFLLVERAYGVVPADDPPFTMAGWVAELSDPQRTRLWDNSVRVLADIARADATALGLDLLARPDLGATPLDQQLRFWRDFYAWTHRGTPSPTIDAAWAWLDAHRPATESAPVVVWGDARPGNLMYGPDQEVTGVFDWEMAAYGPHELDLGYFLFLNRTYTDGLGAPNPVGFADPAATVARFEELSGLAVSDIDWYEAFAGIRGAVLLMRVGTMMIDLGALPPDASMPLANPASFALAAMLDLPKPDAESGWITGAR